MYLLGYVLRLFFYVLLSIIITEYIHEQVDKKDFIILNDLMFTIMLLYLVIYATCIFQGIKYRTIDLVKTKCFSSASLFFLLILAITFVLRTNQHIAISYLIKLFSLTGLLVVLAIFNINIRNIFNELYVLSQKYVLVHNKVTYKIKTLIFKFSIFIYKLIINKTFHIILIVSIVVTILTLIVNFFIKNPGWALLIFLFIFAIFAYKLDNRRKGSSSSYSSSYRSQSTKSTKKTSKNINSNDTQKDNWKDLDQ